MLGISNSRFGLGTRLRFITSPDSRFPTLGLVPHLVTTLGGLLCRMDTADTSRVKPLSRVSSDVVQMHSHIACRYTQYCTLYQESAVVT